MAYGLLASAYFRTDRFPEAESTLQRASERKLETPPILVVRYNIAVLKGDQEEMDRVVSQAKGKRRAEHWMARRLSLWPVPAAYRPRDGHPAAPRSWPCKSSWTRSAASYRASRAFWEAVCGNAAEGIKSALAALELSKGRDVEYAAGFALALSGSLPDRRRSRLKALPGRYVCEIHLRTGFARVSRTAAGQAGRECGAAGESLAGMSWPNGLSFNGYYLGGLHSAYVRGEAFIAAHRYAEAAAEFQKILDHRGIVALDPIGALAHWQLGRVFALSGDKTKAKAAYEAFLALWKDADPGIPILKSAKAEYARL